MPNYIVTTKRLGLRRWLPADLEPFVEMNRDKAVMEFYPNLLTAEETAQMIERIEAHFDKNGFGLFAVEHKQTGQFLGYTGFAIPRFESFFTPCVEIGWRYRRESWGKGFATEAASACLQQGFETLHFQKVVSFTAIINQRSENVMKRIGMKQVTHFHHPALDPDHTLSKHVLYEITRKEFDQFNHRTP